MIYKKFNKYIYKHFFNSENFGETVIMAVDESIMIDFYEKYNVTEQSLIDDFKHTFIYSYLSFDKKENIPQYFGFVAIQIYVAFLMRNDLNFTERAYRPRLSEFLQIDEKYELKRLFENYQEKAWKKIRNWGKKNGYILHIPRAKELQWNRRYVPYPLSQALLNHEDLKRIPLLFQNAGLKPDEYLSFKSFKRLIKDSDYNIDLPSHYYRIKQRLQEKDKEHLLYLQLFGYFNEKWDGSYPGETEKKKNKQNRVEKNRTNLVLNSDRTEISVINQDSICLFKCALSDTNIFNSLKKYYNPFHKEILIFTWDKSYDEWIDCRYLETNQNHIIICKKFSNAESFINKLDSNNIEFKFKYFLMFKVSIGKKRSNHFYWKPFFNPQPKKYEIDGGLKLSRKVWMFGAGPNIIFLKKTDVWINGERVSFEDNNFEISCRNFEVGTYRLKVKDYPPEKIEIKKPNYFPQTITHGWKIDKKNANWEIVQSDYQITGLYTCFPKLQERASVQTWITALTVKPNNQKNSSVIINAIKRAKHGIPK